MAADALCSRPFRNGLELVALICSSQSYSTVLRWRIFCATPEQRRGRLASLPQGSEMPLTVERKRLVAVALRPSNWRLLILPVFNCRLSEHSRSYRIASPVAHNLLCRLSHRRSASYHRIASNPTYYLKPVASPCRRDSLTT